MLQSMLTSSLMAAMVPGAWGHGYVTKPMSKQAMSYQLRNRNPSGMPSSLQYEPWSSSVGNAHAGQVLGGGSSCGAREVSYTAGLQTWQKWYDEAGVAVPTITPGGEFELKVDLNADHGGQAWMMVACGELIDESVPWTFLERAPGDRDHHFMASNPTIFAWATQEAKNSMGGITTARYLVPASFSCPAGHAVGRWVWKTGNTCNDVSNLGRKTESFKLEEFAAVVDSYMPGTQARAACSVPPEHFISCFDFKIIDGVPTPPTPAPLPTPVPTPVPTNVVDSCRAVAGNSLGATDTKCAQACSRLSIGVWPCGREWGLCDCSASPPTPTPSPTPSTGEKACDTEPDSCKSQCQATCNLAVQVNQCWGSPRYVHCECTDGTTHAFSGCECLHGDCATEPILPTPTPIVPTPTPTALGACGAEWEQCGGNGWTGTSCCVNGNTCVTQSEWYSQCMSDSMTS